MRQKPNRLVLVLLLLAMAGLFVLGGGTAARVETIKFAIWDYSLSPEYKEAIESFQKENPGIKVKVIDTSSKEYVDKVTVMLAAGEDVDVIAIKDMPSFAGYVTRKQLLPLDAFVRRTRLDLKDYGGFVEALRVNCRLYGLPYRRDLYILFYNKEIFDRAKVPYPRHEMTWDQFRKIARQLTSGEGNEKVYGAYVHTWKSMVTNPGIARCGGRYSLVDGEYGFLKPVYELFLKMQNQDRSIMSFAEAKTTSAHYRTQFEAGKAGMIYMGTWHIGQLISDKKAGKHNIDWGIVRAPRFPEQNPGSTVGLVTPCGINAKSKKAEAAWKFISFLGGEKGARIFARHGVLPALRTRPILELYTSIKGFPAGGEAALEADQVYLEFPVHPKAPMIEKILQEEHELIMIGQKTIDQGLADMERRVKEVLAEKL
ncbi:MAG: sugar ABC transporter substrate-binding protein [Firmicutes bacterium]|nr:sugar ABC transporter substrate-binding protein [Bacillota bacterium]